MTGPGADLDQALERVIAAARAHLVAVRAADGALDDEAVWDSYVALNNASHEYDQQLLDAYGEATPWETEPIGPRPEPAQVSAPGTEGPGTAAPGTAAAGAGDPYPGVVSVRQRRDFRVSSVSALLAEAGEAVRRLDEAAPAPQTVGEAVLGLVQAGDGALGSLDLPVLEPLQGVVTVSEVGAPLDLAVAGEGDHAAMFAAGEGDRFLGRVDEYPVLDLDGEPAEGEDFENAQGYEVAEGFEDAEELEDLEPLEDNGQPDVGGRPPAPGEPPD